MEGLKSIEDVANYEGNATEVLFKRLHNDKIKNQIIDTLFRGEQSKIGTFIESLEVDEQENVVLDPSTGEPIIKERVPYVPKTREELEQSYTETLSQIESQTEIAFSENPYVSSNVEAMYVGSVAPWSGKPFTPKQMSITEAHEKGHKIREYHGTFFDEYFRAGFDFDDVYFGEKDAAIYRKAIGPEDGNKPIEEVRQIFFEYLSEPAELTERMSQLKNYFGMDSDESFTKSHLDYARVHYISDTEMDNGMTQFFQAITPKTESEFLKIINSVGV